MGEFNIGAAMQAAERAEGLDLLKLRFELITEAGAAEKGKVHEVLVPGGMSLHAMHYMIQRLFGWRNEYPHHYELPEVIYQGIVQDRLASWAELCGVYFSFPDDSVYEEDEYTEAMDIDLWLQDKYTGDEDPNYEIEAFYQNNQDMLDSFLSWLRSGDLLGQKGLEDLRFRDLEELPGFAAAASHLAESISVGDLLYVKNSGADNEDLDTCRQEIRGLMGDWEMILNMGYDPATVPVSGELNYFYDSEDGRIVRVSCVDGYQTDWGDSASGETAIASILSGDMFSMDGDMKFLDHQGKEVPEELHGKLEEVYYKQAPICLDASGRNILG